MIDLENFKRLCERASAAPWQYHSPENQRCSNIESFNPTSIYGYETIISRDSGVYGPSQEDADFIIAARTALPELIAEIEKLRKVLHVVYAALTEHKPHCGHCALCDDIIPFIESLEVTAENL